MHGVFETPQTRTGRVHLNVEAVGIGDFVDAIPGLEGPDLNIAKRHGSTPLKGLGPAPITALEANGPSSKTHRSEEHTSELQSLVRISYAVFCLKKNTTVNNTEQMKTLNTTRSNVQPEQRLH